ncbi:tumor necrosis factor receptor superfamily member 8 isoform X2 [Alexandromys fortis]|uniref:tumor necrosis factor receptor superfamily member 8 isoform X2 n=1 Tax=Alexandromys fortis TaxID=100897 RepID=UPI002152545E|nr:tumor necrosis factor receptor superfamily member 8 isoform X2 [Microtus fortis]
MSVFQAALGLLFLGMLQAFPKDRPLKSTCAGDLSYDPGEAVGSCCHRCPSGLSPTQPCPQGPAHCRKQCDPDHYVNEDGHCTACVTCLKGLVEKAPCSWNSSRVCECQSGSYCKTRAVNSCARCSQHSRCSGGQVVKFPGTAEKDTICELPSPGPGPDCSNPDDCKTFTSHAIPQATPTLKPSATDSLRSSLPEGSTHPVQEDAAELSKVPESPSSQAREPSPDPDNAEMNMTLELPPSGTLPDFSTSENSEEPASTSSTLSLLVDAQTSSRLQPTSPLSTGTPFLDPEFCLDYLTQTFQPKMEQGDSKPFEKPTQPKRSWSVTDASTGHKLSPVNPPTVEMCTNVGAAFLESLPLLDDSAAGNPLTPRDPPETRVSTEHTNNRIEKIYIMKADTVIVGSVKTEVPEGRGLAGSPEPELEAALEVDHAPHYPEQETEPPLGSCTEVMFSVEEGGKEDHEPTTVSEK